jgi:cyclase
LANSLRTRTLLGAVALATIAMTTIADRADAQRNARRELASEVNWWPVRDNIWMLVGAGANVTASIGPDGVFLVNTGDARASERLLAALDEIKTELNYFGFLNGRTPEKGGAETRSRFPVNTRAPAKPIRFIINSNAQPYNVGGNQALGETGTTYSGGNVAGTISDSSEGATILAHENVLMRMIREDSPFDSQPTETYFLPEFKLSTYFNDEGIRLVHIPNATTDGDTIVYFRSSDIVAAGDLFNMTTFPVIDVDKGGHINGVLDGLNYILKLAIPEFRTEGGTMIIPSQGRLSDSADVGYYRDMLTIIRDQVQHHIAQGLSLAQVIEERPTYGYEGRFGADSGPWTTEMFIESVYRSLSEGPN